MKIIIIPILLFFTVQFTVAQSDTLKLSLSEVIELAQDQSPNKNILEAQYLNAYWRFQSLLADYKPDINLTGTIPNLSRRSLGIPDPETGNVRFVRQSQLNNSVGLELSQVIPTTGTSLFLSSELQRTDYLTTPRTQAYLSTPVVLGFSQPLFGFNPHKWNKEIGKISFDESKSRFNENMENLALVASARFFDILIAQLNLESAIREKNNTDSILYISEGRYGVGKISETDLLQISLQAKNAETRIMSSRLQLQEGVESLRDFLGLGQSTFFVMDIPEELPLINVDQDAILQYAKDHTSFFIEQHRRLREAERDVDEAVKSSGIEMGLFGRFGLSKSAEEFNEAYRNPLDEEVISLNFTIPIEDWGKAKARQQISNTQLSITEQEIQRETIQLEQDIKLIVQRLEILNNQVLLGKEALDIADKRLEISLARYRIGKISVTDLNIAINEREQSRIQYVNRLDQFWTAFFQLRSLTLYDVIENKPIYYELPVR